MKKFIQAGFGEPIGRANLDLIKSLGFDGVRLDLQHAVGDALVRELCEEVAGAGLLPLPILADTSQVPALPTSVDMAEFLNEPDLHSAAFTYNMAAQRFISTCHTHGVTPYIGAISNLTPKALEWLQAALPDGNDYRVSIHRYPDDARFLKAHSPYVSREAEVRALWKVIGVGRSFGVSEFGYHDLLQQPAKQWWRRLFFQKDRITPQQQLENVREEFKFWTWAGADFATLYQLNDGTSTSFEDHYGIRTVAGVLKPVAQCCR